MGLDSVGGWRKSQFEACVGNPQLYEVYTTCQVLKAPIPHELHHVPRESERPATKDDRRLGRSAPLQPGQRLGALFLHGSSLAWLRSLPIASVPAGHWPGPNGTDSLAARTMRVFVAGVSTFIIEFEGDQARSA